MQVTPMIQILLYGSSDILSGLELICSLLGERCNEVPSKFCHSRFHSWWLIVKYILPHELETRFLLMMKLGKWISFECQGIIDRDQFAVFAASSTAAGYPRKRINNSHWRHHNFRYDFCMRESCQRSLSGAQLARHSAVPSVVRTVMWPTVYDVLVVSVSVWSCCFKGAFPHLSKLLLSVCVYVCVRACVRVCV